MTAQVPDVIIIRGKRLPLFSTPLEDYLKRTRKRNRPKFISVSTACYRGYVALWEIRDGMLYLNDLNGFVDEDGMEKEVNLETAMPWLTRPAPATWVNDELRCPEGRLVCYAHHNFRSEYERDRIVRVFDGRVEREELRINPPDTIWYVIAPDGRRTRLDQRCGQEAEDLYGPAETPRGARYWARDEPDEEAPEGNELGYVAACYGMPPSAPA